VRETFESYRFHLDAEGFAHRVETPEEPVEVNADPDAVAEALINLLENAVKYSPQTKDITIRVEADAAGARVTVIDRGVGISAEDQAKVFDDYYRTKEARALGTRGSGLGLSLVRHILQGHGGRVELRSTPGVGSEFSLHFPRPAR
jgi:signal transduction histidine kinase